MFVEHDWPPEAVSHELFAKLNLSEVEVLGLRMYTGPVAFLYNARLRAAGTGGLVMFGMCRGQRPECRFTTTLHVVSSGLIKLSRMQPACKIYRGIHGMLLPAPFTAPNVHNVRGGVEYGFMSATLDRSVAERYSGMAKQGEPSLIFEMAMGMVNRGAFLGWLSQYPDEAEILVPPLTGLEILSEREEKSLGQPGTFTTVYEMGLNCNLQSKTIEQVLAVRKRQCEELAEVVALDINRKLASQPADRFLGDRARQAEAVSSKVSSQHADGFNKNDRFTAAVTEIIGLVPRLGDVTAKLEGHADRVFAIAARPATAASPQLLATGSRDKTVMLWQQGRGSVSQDGVADVSTMRCTSLRGHRHAVSSVAFGPRPDGLLASGSLDKTVRLWRPGGPDEAVAVLTGHKFGVAAVAWEPAAGLLLASGSEDQTVRLWRPAQAVAAAAAAGPAVDGAAGSQAIATLYGHTHYVCAVAFAPRPESAWRAEQVEDDQPPLLLASGSADKTIRLWLLNAGSGALAGDGIGAGQVSPPARPPKCRPPLRSTAPHPPQRAVFNVPSRPPQLLGLHAVLSGHTGSVEAVTFGPLSTASQPSAGSAFAAAVAWPAWLASGSMDGERFRHTQKRFRCGPRRLSYRKGRWIEIVRWCATGTIRLWCPASGSLLRVLLGHTSFVHTVAFLPGSGVEGSGKPAGLAIGEIVILLHPPLPLAGVSIRMERGCQRNDSLADG